ncbi:hypothetical protein EUTSA_v10019711mg, partial [Eutrema salsugineum]
NIHCVLNNTVMEFLQGVRRLFTELIYGLGDHDLSPMSLGSSHSPKLSVLLDDLDKKLKTHALMLKKQYKTHFSQLAKIIEDNLLYAKSVKLMGNRRNAKFVDFFKILEDEIEAQLKEAAVISRGKEVSDQHILELCDQVVSLTEDRTKLHDDLKSRMNTVAPNLTALVGELVGARLISRGGGLLNLAEQPGSKIQILGTNGYTFRSLKYHAPLVGQAAPKLKGKFLRSLTSKIALAVRCDALGDGKDNTVRLKSLAKLEERLREIERNDLGRLSRSAKGKSEKDKSMGHGGLITHAKTCNSEAEDTSMELRIHLYGRRRCGAIIE